MVNIALKFLFAHLKIKEAEAAVNHICKWLKVEIKYGPADHLRGKDAVKRAGRECMMYCRNSASHGPNAGMSIWVSRADSNVPCQTPRY